MKRIVPGITLILAACLLASLTPSAHAVVYVKCDSPGAGDPAAYDGDSWATAYHSVQAGLNDAAAAREEVWVARGTYVECITLQNGVGLFGGFAGTEASRDERPAFPRPTPDPDEAILDGNRAGIVVTGAQDYPSAATVDGFTIRNGKPYGIRSISCDMTIRNDRITGNGTEGGIYCGYGTNTIESNIITGNTGIHGGGIDVIGRGTSATISNNIITGTSSQYAGGICLTDCATCTIRGNTISGNTNTGSLARGIVYCMNTSPTISTNTISDNSGIAIYCEGTSAPFVVSNRILRNSGSGVYAGSGALTVRGNRIADNGGGIIAPNAYSIDRNTIIHNAGTGVRCGGSTIVTGNIVAATTSGGSFGHGIVCLSGSPTITNNTVVGNGDTGVMVSSGAILANNIVAFNWNGIDGGSSATRRNNCVYGNKSKNYVNDIPGDGDVSADPKLGSAEYGNMHIQPDSPCLDAGWDAAPGKPSWDIDGESRTQGEHVDIGADESDGTTTWEPGPYVVVRVGPDGNDANDGSTWSLAKRTIKAAAISAGERGGEVWAQAGSYAESLIMMPAFVHMYGGFNGTESTRSQRDWNANTSAITCDYGIGMYGGQQIRAMALDGFTVGGSIATNRSSASICNNTITGVSGDAIHLQMDTSELRNNTIAGNTGRGINAFGSNADIANNAIYENGGEGIYGYASTLTISGNTVSQNGKTGLYLVIGAHVIKGNTIRGNTGQSYGAVYVSGDSVTMNDNLVVGNHVTNPTGNTGAVFVASEDSTILVGNTIAGNDSTGVFETSSYRFTLANNIVAFNGTGLRYDCYRNVRQDNCIYGNDMWDYSSSLAPGVGDISVDPMFVDRTGGDYHIRLTSPCVNAGWNDAPSLPEKDIDGQDRILYGTVDIGADECSGTAEIIREARMVANNLPVSLDGAIVTAAFNGFFYIEAEDRSSGIRVEKSDHDAQTGDGVDVTGALKTNADGERYIEASAVVRDGAGSIRPISITSRDLGGGNWLYNPSTGAGQCGVVGGAGLNNIGLLVTTWGKVNYLDGAYSLDLGTDKTAKILAEGTTIAGQDTFVRITGISSCYKDTDGLHPIIRAISITPVSR